MKKMAESYGFDISKRPPMQEKRCSGCTSATSPAERAERRSDGPRRTSIYLTSISERDLASGLITESQAQEIIDDFVIKLRIVRFLRHARVRRALRRRPDLGHRVDRRPYGRRRRTLVTKTSFRLLCRRCTTLGPAPEPKPHDLDYSPLMPTPSAASRRRSAIDTSSCSSRATRSCAALGRRRRDRLLRLADAARQADAVLRRARQPRKLLLYAINGGRDEIAASRSARRSEPSRGDVLDFDDVLGSSSG
jgi:formate C-acetyltransferase